MGKSYAVAMVIKAKDTASPVFGKVGRGLKSLGGAARGVGSQIASLVTSPIRALSGAGSFLAALPGVSLIGSALKSAVTGLRDLAMGASEAGSNFNDLMARTGIGGRSLQEVAYAADQAGVSFDEFSAGLLKMTGAIGKGVKGGQLRMLGNDASRFVKAIKGKDRTEAFELVLRQMAAIPDASKRAAFAQVFFGRSGIKLAAIAADGAEGLKKMRREAEELGLVMSDGDIARADDFGDTIGSLEKAFKGIKTTFGSGLIEGLLPDLKSLLTKFKENRVEVMGFVRDLGKKVGEGVVAVAEGLVSAFGWLKDNGPAILAWAERLAVLFGGLKLGSIISGLGGGAAGGIGAVGGKMGCCGTGVPGVGGGTPGAPASGGVGWGKAVLGVLGSLAGAAAAVWIGAEVVADNLDPDVKNALQNRIGERVTANMNGGGSDIEKALGMTFDVLQSPKMLAQSLVDATAVRETRAASDAANADYAGTQGQAAMQAALDAIGFTVDGRFGADQQSIEVRVVLEDPAGVAGTPTVTSKGPIKPKVVHQANTGKRTTSHAKGG